MTGHSMQEQTHNLTFPKHFDGKRFYNPDAPQALSFLDALRWKLGSRPESSPSFISDVQQSIPPRHIEGSGMRITLVNHSLDRSPALKKARCADSRMCRTCSGRVCSPASHATYRTSSRIGLG
jgi:hypothetical protein